MRQIKRMPPNTKAILLIAIGLATGAWYAYNIATDNAVASYPLNILADILFPLTMLYVLLWTITRNRRPTPR